jgi:hypothetical protein
MRLHWGGQLVSVADLPFSAQTGRMSRSEEVGARLKKSQANFTSIGKVADKAASYAQHECPSHIEQP